AYSESADAYKMASDSGKVLPYVRRAQLYSLARAPHRIDEAIALARRLYREDGNNGPPTLLCVLFTLEMRQNPDLQPLELAIDIFRTAERAYDYLSTYWVRTHERFPMDGV